MFILFCILKEDTYMLIIKPINKIYIILNIIKNIISKIINFLYNIPLIINPGYIHKDTNNNIRKILILL